MAKDRSSAFARFQAALAGYTLKFKGEVIQTWEAFYLDRRPKKILEGESRITAQRVVKDSPEHQLIWPPK